jgi:hypothetical protein
MTPEQTAIVLVQARRLLAEARATDAVIHAAYAIDGYGTD